MQALIYLYNVKDHTSNAKVLTICVLVSFEFISFLEYIHFDIRIYILPL